MLVELSSRGSEGSSLATSPLFHYRRLEVALSRSFPLFPVSWWPPPDLLNVPQQLPPDAALDFFMRCLRASISLIVPRMILLVWVRCGVYKPRRAFWTLFELPLRWDSFGRRV